MTEFSDPLSLLDLPLQTLVVLASGYLAYRLAFTGKDMNHQTVDVLFATFTFAAVAKLIISLVGEDVLPQWGAPFLYALALAGALASAAAWRRFGENRVFMCLRFAGISTSDRHRTAFETMISRGGLKPSQIVVRKTDGKAVMCERLSDFSNAAFGPCLLGPDGSVALYVTDFRPAGAKEWETIPVAPTDWGPAITYIPASEVSEIVIRYPINE